MRFANITQENGEKLVGQCEISHPVPAMLDNGPFVAGSSIGSGATDIFSPIDGMGEIISQRNNVMYDRQSQDEYTPMSSRISRMHI